MGGRAIVSGGTGGLGRSVVRALLADGWRVAVPYRNPRAWDELRGLVDGSDALWGAPAELDALDGAQRFVEQALGWLAGLEGVAALAGGYSGSERLESAPASEWQGMLRANLQTTYATCRATLPHLLVGGGSVVTVSAKLAESAAPRAAAYGAAKAGVLSLTRSLAAENRGRGVRFNCIVPATIDTPANRQAMPEADRSRWTSPETIARVVLFLLSPEAAAVTGAAIPVAGA